MDPILSIWHGGVRREHSIGADEVPLHAVADGTGPFDEDTRAAVPGDDVAGVDTAGTADDVACCVDDVDAMERFVDVSEPVRDGGTSAGIDSDVVDSHGVARRRARAGGRYEYPVEVVPGDDVAPGGDRPADPVARRILDEHSLAAVAGLGRTVEVEADVVALDLVVGGPGIDDVYPGVGVAADAVARAGGQPTDSIAGRPVYENAVVQVLKGVGTAR
jgi:hypothetical protein